MSTLAPSLQEASTNTNLDRRFAGVARLYGVDGLEKFRISRIMVIGVGGVGSWVTEALVRSGIGELILIDLDHVSESNTNRQIHALEGEYGKAKVVALKERTLRISPQCQVQCVEDFVSPDNVDSLIPQSGCDFVVDCIDDFKAKAAIIAHCKRVKIPMITVGGAGGQSDPTQIQVVDLSRSIHDPLLSKTRQLLRKQYGFPKDKSMRVKCVYSKEQSIYPQANGEVDKIRSSTVGSSLHCGGLGSATHVTASFGFVAVSYILRKLKSTSK